MSYFNDEQMDKLADENERLEKIRFQIERKLDLAHVQLLRIELEALGVVVPCTDSPAVAAVKDVILNSELVERSDRQNQVVQHAACSEKVSSAAAEIRNKTAVPEAQE